MAKGRSDYFGFGRLISIIFAIIPFTSWLFGAITRFQEGHWICALIRLIFGFTIVWVLDLILIILTGKILRLA